ncbi:MAG: bifunctional oligoribonuclease/PAP phosphatase NrnA [Actinomycetota bacterium]|nr:bifunctional oligoribonuclease/PAP phosphatase NrnA [Actinomycetota bacterium]
MSDLTNAADLLKTAPDVTLFAHVNPDADALGSAFALGMALRTLGATVRVSFGSPAVAPEALVRLDPAGLLVAPGDIPARPAMIVALDCGSAARLGVLADRVDATIAGGGRVLVIDHHVGNTRFGTDHLVDDTAVATAVLVLALIDELGVPLTEDIARCVYAGVVTDTSGFRRATPDTHRIAARLLEAGVDAERLTRELVDSHPFAWLRLLSTALDRVELVPDAAGGHGLVHTAIFAAELATVRPEDVDSVIDLIRATTEADVAVVAKELTPGTWTVSLRSIGQVDVRAVATALGGGGHRLAAGFTARGTVHEILASVKVSLG